MTRDEALVIIAKRIFTPTERRVGRPFEKMSDAAQNTFLAQAELILGDLEAAGMEFEWEDDELLETEPEQTEPPKKGRK